MSPNEAFSLIKNDILQQDKRITHWADLGCGTGLFTQALSRLLQPGSRIHGIDTRPSLKRQTTPNGVELIPQQMDFVTGDWAGVRQGTSGEPDNSLQNLDGVLLANSQRLAEKPSIYGGGNIYAALIQR